MPKFPKRKRTKQHCNTITTFNQPIDTVCETPVFKPVNDLITPENSSNTQPNSDNEETKGYCQLRSLHELQSTRCACEDIVNKQLDNLYNCNKSGQLQRIISSVRAIVINR